MRQQINLYQPTKADAGKLFTAATTAPALGLVTILLLMIYGYGVHAVAKLANNVQAARETQQKQTTMLASGAEDSSHTVELGTLQADLKKTNATLNEHRRALQLLNVGAAGGDSGFSKRLIALAHQHIDGVWLDHIVLSSNAGVDNLSGGTIDAELIPQYLHGLAAEPALVGTRFDEFSIDGKNTVISTTDDANTEGTRSTIQFHAANTGSKAASSTGNSGKAENVANKVPAATEGST